MARAPLAHGVASQRHGIVSIENESWTKCCIACGSPIQCMHEWSILLRCAPLAYAGGGRELATSLLHWNVFSCTPLFCLLLATHGHQRRSLWSVLNISCRGRGSLCGGGPRCRSSIGRATTRAAALHTECNNEHNDSNNNAHQETKEQHDGGQVDEDRQQPHQ